MADRIFTKKELKELGTRTIDLISAAIDGGDKEKAKKLGRHMFREFFSMHDLYVDWVTHLLTFIYQNYGDRALADSLGASYGKTIRHVIGLYTQEKSMRRKVELFASALKGHLEGVTIEEDDEKFTFICDPCGSGGRLARRGGYKPPMNMGKVKKAQPLTYSTKGFPIYCTHCPLQEMVSIEETGRPWIIANPPKNLISEPCRIYMYKDTAEIPEKWYQRVGKKKGKRKVSKPKR